MESESRHLHSTDLRSDHLRRPSAAASRSRAHGLRAPVRERRCHGRRHHADRERGRARRAISSTLFGIFFEDINFAADGGIYAEKIKNRSFEFPDALMGWRRRSTVAPGNAGTFTVRDDAPPSPQNPHYLRITSKAGYGVSNDGFRGIGFSKGQKFRFSMLARIPPGGYTGAVGAGRS